MSKQVFGAGDSYTWDISWTKLCPVDGPIYSMGTYDKMSPSCDFIFFAVILAVM